LDVQPAGAKLAGCFFLGALQWRLNTVALPGSCRATPHSVCVFSMRVDVPGLPVNFYQD